MEVIHQCVAGLDVHKDSVVACVRIVSEGETKRECRTFDTTTAGLESLRDWLSSWACKLVAMEATGVYWMPVWRILDEGAFTLMVVNARHIKAVPGRKTDMNDAMWIADLATFGLLRGSFVPDEEFHELRTLMRTRKQLVREQTSHVQRIQKTLTDRLDSVISDIMGLNGRRIIEAMIAGVRDPRQLAGLGDRRLKATPKELYDALHGRLTEHHRFLLKLHMAQHDGQESAIRSSTPRVEKRVARLDKEAKEAKEAETPFSGLIELLVSIPGVSRLSATTILSKIGRDMSRFPTAGHLVAWSGLCPGQNESAGKRKRSRLRKGAPWLRPCSFNAPGRPSGRKTAPTGRSSFGCRPDAVRRKPSARSPPRS